MVIADAGLCDTASFFFSPAMTTALVNGSTKTVMKSL